MTSDPALATALEKLSLQVSPDNILAAHKVFADHARTLLEALMSIGQNARMGVCGGDPVSEIAASERSFGGKIEQLLEVHRAHQLELTVAADHLRQIALTYGFTEAEIDRSLNPDR